jgi:hypothetical protein
VCICFSEIPQEAQPVELEFFQFFARPPTSEKRSSWTTSEKVEKHDGTAAMVLL